MSASETLPLNLADTGPILTASATEYWLSPLDSNLSQPGMHFLRVSGSLSASQTCCCVSPRRRLPSISMSSFLFSEGRDGALAAGSHQGREARGQLFECLQIVDCEHPVCIAGHNSRTAPQRG